MTVKLEPEKCWRARSQAVKAVYEGLDDLTGLLETLSEDEEMTLKTRSYQNN